MKIERLDHNGRGIGYLNGKICFVNNALPGENIEVRNIIEKKKYYLADIQTILEFSKSRRKEECPFFYSCGGCNIMHMDYDEQILFKKNKLKDILKKFAKTDCEVEFIKADKEFNYRDKITLKVKNNKIGYFKNKSNELVVINRCLLGESIINDIINELNKIKDFKSCYEISIRNVNSDKTALTFYLHNINETIDIKNNNYNINYIYDSNLSNCERKGKIIGKINNLGFYISPQSFFQINVNQTQKILDFVKNKIQNKGKNLLDLYCGTGLIGIYMADVFEKVLGIEICEPAVIDAKKNSELNNIDNIDFYCGDTEKLIKNINTKFDTLIVDPPRSGLNKNIINDIFRINPETLVYISCDPVTLARDLNDIMKKYSILNVTGFDMFPNTYHVETVCILEKNYSKEKSKKDKND